MTHLYPKFYRNRPRGKEVIAILANRDRQTDRSTNQPTDQPTPGAILKRTISHIEMWSSKNRI